MRTALGLIALAVAACGGSTAPGGSTEAPPGSGNGNGADMATGSGRGGDMATGAGGGDMAIASPVALENASFRNGNLTFILDDRLFKMSGDPTIARVDVVDLAWGSQTATIRIACSTPPWTIALPRTSALTVSIASDGQSLTATYDCNDMSGYTSTAYGVSSPPGGTLNVSVEGILDDATPFTAAAVVQAG